MRNIYLDYNATTPTAPEVVEAMTPYLTEHFGNPSSSHAWGRAAQEAVEAARGQVARMLGCSADEIVFTGGGSEANNLAIKGAAFRPKRGKTGCECQGHVIVSAVEHPAVMEPAKFLQRLGFEVTVIPCDAFGVVDVGRLEEVLKQRPDTKLVSVMHANNEVGVMQPIRRIAEACRAQGVLLHTDAAQTIGKAPTHIEDLGVDLLTMAGHKFYAPKGVGALFVRRGVSLEPLIHGAGQEGGLRAGTENVAYIVGLGRASALAAEHLPELGLKLTTLRNRLEARLSAGLQGRLMLNGHPVNRLPNTLHVNFPDVDGRELLRRAPEVSASVGSACHSGAIHLSPTLAAMGVPPDLARGAVRLSLGMYTTEQEVDQAADALLSAWESLTAG